MIIKDVINLAKYSELHGVAIKDNVEAVTAFINLGILELYKRFPVKVEEHVLSMVDGTFYYDMPTNFMYALEAYREVPENSEVQTVPVPINDEDNTDSLFFNTWNVVQVPSPVTGSHVSIIYVSKPTPVTATEAEDGVTELDLPDTLIDCLLGYIGYRAHLGVKSDAQTENNAHWARFERSCKKARELGVAFPVDSMSMVGRIGDRGFV